jgi:hypothetical protein
MINEMNPTARASRDRYRIIMPPETSQPSTPEPLCSRCVRLSTTQTQPIPNRSSFWNVFRAGSSPSSEKVGFSGPESRRFPRRSLEMCLAH